MGHDWSHNIDRKTVSNNTNENHAEQISCDSTEHILPETFPSP
jgi:hypothetical protein